MRKKFIFWTLAVILVISVVALAFPMLMALPGAEAVTADESAMIMTTDLAEIDTLATVSVMAPEVDVGMLALSESILINEAEVPGQTASAIPLYVALSATLITLSVISRRVRLKLFHLIAFVSRQVDNRGPASALSGGGIRNGIRPTAAA